MSSQEPSPRTWAWEYPKHDVLLDNSCERINIEITDISKVRTALSSRIGDNVRIRIISIYSENTVSPLQITNDLLEYIIDTYEIHHSVADVIASFGYDPNKAEGSSNNNTIHVGPSSCEISYQIRYVEQNKRSKLNPWSLRHTGVYHHHSATSETDTMLLLHPVLEPAFRTKIRALQDDIFDRGALCSNPFLLHTWLFSQYFCHWRWYYRYLDDRFAEDNQLAMVMKPERAEPNVTFRRVKSLRNTNDMIIFARACCAGNLDLIERLRIAPMRLLSDLDGMSSHASKMKGYVESADVLKGSVQNLIDLVGYTLTLHNQMEAAKVQLEAAKIDAELRDLTEGIKKLGEQSVDDSATVKIITFVSAVYLPGSFIATLYGMNFFLLNPESKRFQISPDFWIFVITWIPLTLVTGGMYVLFLYLHAKRQGQQFHWPWQTKSRVVWKDP
ncbi:hypothetical protein B0J11DRAFT_424563 [Dendryphion nanum]|uniref:CorA-like transporter domain-containing protein n=1 Tax=Dendryphion nanum TaxID=256645 RepID=A0A9P9EE93_9PLEO|nr:hypothetical protein B0J11DRAFT_424563 [Dendryphion nanum]